MRDEGGKKRVTTALSSIPFLVIILLCGFDENHCKTWFVQVSCLREDIRKREKSKLVAFMLQASFPRLLTFLLTFQITKSLMIMMVKKDVEGT